MIEQRLAALEARVEARGGVGGPRGADDSWALRGLTERIGEGSVVLFAGSVTPPEGEHLEWQEAAGTASLLQADPTQADPT